MSEDIVCTRAVHLEDYDGIKWMRKHLWCYIRNGKVSYSVCDDDGDHCRFDGRSVGRFMREAAESWVAYGKWAAETGLDPLQNYLVEREIKRTESWSVVLASWIGASTHGLAILSARRKGGKAVNLEQLPKPAAEFMGMEKAGTRYCAAGINKIEDVQYAKVTKKRGTHYWVSFEVEFREPRSPEAIAADIRRIAGRVD